MFTDIVGFSKQMGANEQATMKLLEVHNSMLSGIISMHGGRIIKSIGDAYFVEFESAYHAVECAIECQKSLFEWRNANPKEHPLKIRIGIHVGDVISKDEDLFGDGVNIAARIQPKAQPGGICISGDVARQLRGKHSYTLHDLGEANLKNISQPIRLFNVILPWEKQKNSLFEKIRFQYSQRPLRWLLILVLFLSLPTLWYAYKNYFSYQTLPQQEKSFALLPFKNVGESVNKYLTEGIENDIINRLSNRKDLLVISRSSSLKYQESKLPAINIASELGVRFLVEGTIQITEQTIFTSIEITDIKEHRNALSLTFEKPKIEIAQIAETVENIISEHFGVHSKSMQQYQVNFDGYVAYTQGIFHTKKIDKTENSLAIDYLKDVVNDNTAYIPGLIDLSRCQLIQIEYGWDQSKNIYDAVKNNTESIFKVEPHNSDAFALLGKLQSLQGFQEQAILSLSQSLQNNPNNLLALTSLASIYLFSTNEPIKAVKLLTKAHELDPNNWITTSNLGIGYAQMKNYPLAYQSFIKAIQLNPDGIFPWKNLAYLFERQEKYDSAMFAYLKAIEIAPSFLSTYESSIGLALHLGNYALADSMLRIGMTTIPGSVELYYLDGVSKDIQGKPGDARISFEDGLRIVTRKVEQNSRIADLHTFAALFHARLRQETNAIKDLSTAFSLDSTNDEIIMKIARTYAILQNTEKVKIWLKRAKRMNPEYDMAYLSIIPEFKRYLTDRDIVAIANEE